MRLSWVLVSLLHINLSGMEQATSNLKVTLENQLTVPLKYWAVIQEHNRSLVHGKASGDLNPMQHSSLDLNPESTPLYKMCIFPLKLHVTVAQKDKTMTKRYYIEEAGHYVLVPDIEEIFVIKKRVIQQP